jgi:phosphoribosylformylglycinamidine synthase subunit PurQ / glutaminase
MTLTVTQPAVGIVVFPGSNCERDCQDAVRDVMGLPVKFLWHQDADLQDVAAIILPGGFSYGDYLRAGALAKLSPVMASIKAFAAKGKPVLGICNGFQILTEAQLLPGCLVKNQSLNFLCQPTGLVVENNQTPFTRHYDKGQRITLPIAHAEGNYTADADTITRLEDNQQVVFRYDADVNGAINRIAGICNVQRNVLGLMPHPERNLSPHSMWTGEGAALFAGLLRAL